MERAGNPAFPKPSRRAAFVRFFLNTAAEWRYLVSPGTRVLTR